MEVSHPHPTNTQDFGPEITSNTISEISPAAAAAAIIVKNRSSPLVPTLGRQGVHGHQVVPPTWFQNLPLGGAWSPSGATLLARPAHSARPVYKWRHLPYKRDLLRSADHCLKRPLMADLGKLVQVQHECPLAVNFGSLDRSRHECPLVAYLDSLGRGQYDCPLAAAWGSLSRG